MSAILNKTIDEKFSSIFEPGLYPNTIFKPGDTFSDRFRVTDAGTVYVHKLAPKTIVPALPGGDYVHTTDADTLIQISMNNTLMYSEKISKIADLQTAYPIVTAEMEEILKSAGLARDFSGLACLKYEGTAASGTSALTTSNIEAEILAVKTQLEESYVNATTVLCSPKTYNMIIAAAGPRFTPIINEKMNVSGEVGIWLGMKFINCPQLGNNAAKYIDYSGTLRTVNLSGIDFIMYNKDALSIVDQLDDAGVVDGKPIFPGSFVQLCMVVGYRVTNSACVVARSTVTSNPG